MLPITSNQTVCLGKQRHCQEDNDFVAERQSYTNSLVKLCSSLNTYSNRSKQCEYVPHNSPPLNAQCLHMPIPCMQLMNLHCRVPRPPQAFNGSFGFKGG